MKKNVFIILIALIMLTGIAQSVQAVPLQDLFDGGTITVDDKLFFDWTLIDVVSTDPQSDPVFSEFDVTGFPEPMNTGLLFQDLNQTTVFDDNFLDITFGFSVEVLNPNLRIKDVSFILLDGILNGDGFIGAVEDVYADNGDQLASLFIDTAFMIAEDAADFAQQQVVHVEKNILIGGLFPGDEAGLFAFSQSFSQTQIPEPSTIFLLGSGLIGLAAFARKYRK